MELFLLIGAVVNVIVLIQFFRIGTDIAQLNRSFTDFTKYYYDLQNYRLEKEKPGKTTT